MSVFYVAVGILINDDGLVLVTKRPHHKKDYPDFFEFPGGKVEKDELPMDALVREFDEELGLNLDISSIKPLIFHVVPRGHQHACLLVYTVKKWEGFINLRENQEEFYWKKPKDITSMHFLSSMEGIIDSLEKEINHGS